MSKFKQGDRVLVTARFFKEDVEMVEEPCQIVSSKSGYHTIMADSDDYNGTWTVIDCDCLEVSPDGN